MVKKQRNEKKERTDDDKLRIMRQVEKERK